MKTESMDTQFLNAEIIRNKQFHLEKEVDIKNVGKLKIKFM